MTWSGVCTQSFGGWSPARCIHRLFGTRRRSSWSRRLLNRRCDCLPASEDWFKLLLSCCCTSYNHSDCLNTSPVQACIAAQEDNTGGLCLHGFLKTYHCVHVQ